MTRPPSDDHPPRPGLQVRRMVEEDIPHGLRLCRAAAWNQVAQDWRLYLGQNPRGCSVMMHKGRVVGTVVTVDYQGRSSWIGMVLVDPDFRRRGIGTRLLHLAMEHLQGCETLKLDATPAGREVYLPLGFVDEYPLMRMETEVRGGPFPEAELPVEPLTERHLPAVLEMDRRAFGLERGHILRVYRQAYPDSAWVCLSEGRLAGYCLGRQGHSYNQVGPVVATEPAAARALVVHRLAGRKGQRLLADAHLHDADWVAWLKSQGFRDQRPYTRMFKGPNNHPGEPGLQYTILGPELG